MPKLYLLFLFLLAGFSVSYAQLLSRFLVYGVKDGLSQNSVHAIFRDRDGLMWFGTQDGLNSFDGKNFTIYRYNENDSNSLSDQFILNIQEDNAGNIWVGTRNGLNSFNKRTKKFRRYYVNPEEKHTFQSAYFDFFIQKDNNLVVNINGAYILNIVSGKSIHIPSPSPSGKESCWLITPDYKAWAIDSNNRFFFFPDLRKKQFKDLGLSPFGTNTDNKDLFSVHYKDSLLYVFNKANADEIFVFNIQTQSLSYKIYTPSNITHLTVINPDEIYASSARGLIKIGRQGKALPLMMSTNENGLPPTPVLTTYKDNESNLWVGMSGSGAAVTNSSFENFRLIKPAIQNDVISCITMTGTTLYAGTRSGLFKIENFTGHKPAEKFHPVFKGKGITGVTADLKGNIWAGVQGEGIYVLNKKEKIIKKFPLIGAVSGTAILYMNTDSKGRIMICTSAGFFMALSANSELIKFKSTEKEHFIRGDYVMNAFEDRDLNIWISNNLGLDVFSKDLFKQYSFKSDDDQSSSIKRTIITSVTQDKSGAMWIATIRSGLYKYYDNKFTHYTTSSGLASDVIYNLVCDEKNRIWATTSAGLNIFNEQLKSFTTLSVNDGIPPSAYVFGAAYKNGNDILFGTSEGLLICKAGKAKLNNATIRGLVSDVKINGESIPVNDNNFEIMPDGKIISFEFSSVPAFYSGNIIYQYRLKGQHDDWITLPKGVHTISYTGLPYKKLGMEVRAAGSVNNLASAKVYSIQIKSKAPFLKSTLFILIVAIIFAVIIFLLVTDYNKRKYTKRFRALEVARGLHEERVRIGRDLHDNIGAYTSALIAGLNHIKSGDLTQETHVNDLKEYGSNIMGFLRETIWMLNSETLTITSFADRFKNYSLRISKNYPAADFQFREEILHDKTLAPTLMLNLFRILQEALQNACKHADASVITITIKNTDVLYFEVKDNGKGFSENPGAENYGLTNMKQRAAESGFMLTISAQNAGTCVSLTENTANAALHLRK